MRKVISLYTGAGGLDLGLEAAGFETRVCVEMDPDSVATLKANGRQSIIPRDIHSVSGDEIPSTGELREGEADLLVGGPPCQPFSKSAYWAKGDTKRLEDPRASTLERYLWVLRVTKPKAFLLENVPGLAYAGKDEGLNLFLELLEGINRETGSNYRPAWRVLSALEYGVPQDRKRLFMVGQRDGLDFAFPPPTHGSVGVDGQLYLNHREPTMTAWDAIGDLEDDDDPSLAMRGKWAALLPSIPEGSNYLYHTDRGEGMNLFGWRTRFWNFLLKLAKRQPAWTITAQPGSAVGPFHWKNRRLSILELCRLQTFPDGYRITGSHSAAQRQLGNAVPSALAETLGLAIRAQLFGDADASGREVSLIPSRRNPVPAVEPVLPVPTSYHQLFGDHAAHPGTGKGRGALARALQ